MPPEHVISAQNLSKSYRIWENPARRLFNPILAECGRLLPGAAGRAISSQAKSGYRDFFALDGVEFEVKPGEAVGILGRNGAGKSTLLQLIAKTLQPTSGSIEVQGRVAALLELGAGFNIDFTGRENVFLSGAILGLNQKEMESRFDEVAAFADIGDFIEQPVKTYSSGMMMRLAFAVNTCVDPDILIVDEALSVGDAPFQSKCFRRLRQLIDQGVSLLFVSHDLGTVRSICSRALWLKDGRTEMWGDAKNVAKAYERFCWKEQGVSLETSESNSENNSTNGNEDFPKSIGEINSEHAPPPELFTQNETYQMMRSRSNYGTGHASIENIFLSNKSGRSVSVFEYGEEMRISLLVKINRSLSSDCIISFLLRDLKGNSIIATQDVTNRQRIEGNAGQLFFAQTTLPLNLHHQKYVLHTAIFGFKDGQSHAQGYYDFGNAVLWDVVDEAAFIEVQTCSIMPLSGPVHLDRPVEIAPVESPKPTSA